ncbi:MarR family winged helix-turn-helix transcriptional regulator [Umezawaea tangerina]|uniref:DNA-binding MarR family transcriptional regulator n=1 Tax=Umezawaea tangerina TaxID=84725 RepID=A0A2T0TGH5_9PSEU|nr:MarR family winged helix-turn-helix transcriptional regulator [Umezawaea tangerina]PRY44731.1 DNA-binding MarR family transcriptional regulator [Umezawaea tangerina]
MDGSDVERAVRLNHEVFLRTGDLVLDVLARHGLTHATAHALWAIDPAEPPPSMKVMAERLYCNAPNLTFVAGQLVAKGLAERAVDPADRRSRVLVLTEDGVRVRAEVMRETLERTPFANLDHEQLAALVRLLDTALGAPPEN